MFSFDRLLLSDFYLMNTIYIFGIVVMASGAAILYNSPRKLTKVRVWKRLGTSKTFIMMEKITITHILTILL